MKKLLKRILALIRQIFQQFSSTDKPSSPPSYHPPETPTPPIPPIPTFVPQWKNGLVLVCSQCTVEQFSGSSHRINRGETASEELQNWLKCRVCPQSRVVVVLRHDAVGQQCFIVDPRGEREILYSYLVSRVRL